FNRDSGAATGQRHIRGGRANVRRALYMAALTATRCNPVLRPFYQQLRARGKGHRVAITAVMRKLLVHLNQLMRTPEVMLASQHS
ncbi:MAG TPA: transposase, partial [Lacunisphaera sp.]|nr:transposase [Lacunisphaera sp.]